MSLKPSTQRLIAGFKKSRKINLKNGYTRKALAGDIKMWRKYAGSKVTRAHAKSHVK